MRIVGPLTFTQKAQALARLRSLSREPKLVYWLCAEPGQVRVAAELYRSFSAGQEPVFEIDSSAVDFTVELERLMEKQSGVCAVTAQSLSQLSPALSLLAADRAAFHVGQNVNPVHVKQRLAKTGYGDESEPFACYGKGATIFVHNPGGKWRITCGELGIESIINEQTAQPINSVVLPPATLDLTEVPPKDIPLPPGVILADEADRQDFLKQLPPFARDWVSLIFAPFSQDASDFNAGTYSDAPLYAKKFERLGKDMRTWLEQGYAVHLYALDTELLATALAEAGVNKSPQGVNIIGQKVPMRGFISPTSKLVVLTHAELFGRRKAIKKSRRRDSAAFVTSLAVNDYVVHEDHGVGRYLGLVTSTIEGHERENLLIEYAKGDKLYVPVELAYKIDRYVGQAKPGLQRLSGTSWLRVTRQAAHDSQAFAKDLLMLYARRSLIRVEPWHIDESADRALHASFGYEETPDQERAIQATYEGLTREEPIDMLVVGDVGFGKTEVAIRAAYQAYMNKRQVVVLCPTTLLAQQHLDTFAERLRPLGVSVEMLSRFTGKVESSTRKAGDIVADVKAGKVDVVIGTHRLLSRDIGFAKLGLIIIDEEQRFGVRHKERLKSLRSQAHVLTLSATPIPRTLYFSLSGLRDIATIQTPPQGRQPIETSIESYREERVKEVIDKELARGGQAFYLHNHVQTIYGAKRRLQELLGARVRIGIVHGQMPEDEMAAVVSEFDHGRIDVLVCTTIVENGLDMPNVNTLVVENAALYGLGQLYQIRGRIGRGKARAFAYFFYPESGLKGLAAKRLQILQEAQALGSGFQLAMRDLEMRGMGQMIGKRQHGHIQQVGLGLYGKLLRQAVEELESGALQPARHSVTINSPVDYGLSESLIPNAETRSRLYRQLSQAESSEEADRLLEPWQAAIAQLSPDDQRKLRHLLDLLQLRRLAERTPIISVDYQESRADDGALKQRYQVVFTKLEPSHVDTLTQLSPAMKVTSPNTVIMPADEIIDHVDFVSRLLSAVAGS